MADQTVRRNPFGWKLKRILNEIERQDTRKEKRREKPRKIRFEEKINSKE
jgi:hypothetical protein